MHISFIATIVAVLVVISACKIQISVPKDGKVQSESGSFSCGSNQDCEIEVNDVFFDQTFVAIPNNGYEFEGWKREAFYLCGGSTEPCHVYTSFFEGNDVLMGILESDDVWNLEPRFKKPNSWATRANMKTNHAEFSSCTVDGKVYAFGGRKGLTRPSDQPMFTTTVEEYDPESDQWRVRGNTPTERKHTTASAIGEKCFISGGQTNAFGSAGPATATLEAYEPSTNSWSTLADMPTARTGAASAVVNGKLYVIGGGIGGPGSGNVAAKASVEMYDPETDMWTSRASMPTARAFLGAAAINGKIYAAGGTQNYTVGNLDILEQYDPATDSWKTLAPMTRPKAFYQLVAINNRVYALGGFRGYWAFDNGTFAYNPKTNKWVGRAPMLGPRGLFAAEAVNGRIYVFGGLSGASEPAFALTDEYTP
jgi:N-acetylneuraminic acid mutarotase